VTRGICTFAEIYYIWKMKKILSTGTLLAFSLILFAQQLPTKAEIVNKMKLVNDYWISQNVAPGNNQWARAVYFTGNMDFYKIYPKDTYLQYANLWANNNGWALNGGSSTRNADNQTCGQVYIDLYNLDAVKVPTKIAAIKTSVDNMVYSTVSNDWSWIDALYMAMPVFARLGALTNDSVYFQRMYDIYTDTKVTRALLNTTEGLWYRDANYKPPYKTTNGQDCYWSRGNGWVVGAHVRVLQQLPFNNSHRAEFVQTLQLMAAALKNRQRPDGFWNPSLDDANEYTDPETSGTVFFTYGLAWGINNHVLDSATYAPVVVKAWNGLVSTAVMSTGFLGYVQGVGAAPALATAGTTQDFGVGGFLLAGTEVLKMASGVMPIPTNFSMKSVKVVDNTHIRVSFSKKIDLSTALATPNYSINNSITVSNANKGDNDSTSVLTISPLSYGSYQLQINNITSADGSPVENGETKTFIYTGIAAVTASGFEPGTSNTADKTVDYDFATRWSCDGKGQWILYDLGETKMVSSVDIAFFNGNVRKGIFSMYLSTDLTDSVQVFNGSSSGKSAALENYDFSDQPARYVKIIGQGNTQSTWNSISETRINWTNLASGIHSVAQNNLKFYPNPLTGNELNISMPNNIGSNELIISDMCGKTVYAQTLSDTNKTVRIPNLKLASGAYTVQLRNSSDSNSGLLLAK
jgi:rhamnogalacturonyl hydrolase YesR/methionine-rich copper-binding protein CopC